MTEIEYAVAPKSKWGVWHAVRNDYTLCGRNARGWGRRPVIWDKPGRSYVCCSCWRILEMGGDASHDAG